MICKKCKKDKEEGEFPFATGVSYHKKRDGSISVYTKTYKRKVCLKCYHKQQYKNEKKNEQKLIAY